MLDFCGEHGIHPEIETIRIERSMKRTTGWSRATSATASSSTWRQARRLPPSLGVAALVPGRGPGRAPKPFDPVAFFTGATHGRGELRELMGKPKKTSAQSVGRVDKDGWLILDQKVAIEAIRSGSGGGG